jgi:hypothetical protein
MDKATAKQIIIRMDSCMNLLNEVVQIAHANCGEQEDRVVRRGVGYVLSEMQDRLTDPILREYPDMVPQGITYTPLKGPTLSDLAAKIGPPRTHMDLGEEEPSDDDDDT